VPKSNGGSDDLTNLKTVCERCHNAIHGDVMAPTNNQQKSNSFDMDASDYIVSFSFFTILAILGVIFNGTSSNIAHASLIVMAFVAYIPFYKYYN